jgi:hypothetical protein
MHPTSFQNADWVLGIFLNVSLCVLAVRHGLFYRLPSFAVYLFLLVVREAAWWAVYHVFGPQARIAFVTYWVMQAVMLLARGGVVAEICWRLLNPYTGVWRVARQVLLATCAVLVAVALLRARLSGPKIAPIVLAGERGLEFAVVGILLFGLAFSRYYQVRIDRPISLVALGLGLYSAIQIVNNSLLQVWKQAYFFRWDEVRILSFQLAMVIWCVALWKPLAAEQAAPPLLEPHVYGEVVPVVNLRLDALNSKLQEMLK